jgi:hypothetical protein
VRWPIATALILGLAATPAVATGAAKDNYYGLGAFGATQWHNDPIWHTTENYDWREFHLNPIVGRHRTDRWDVWIEGNVGFINWDDVPDTVELGAGVMNSYDFVVRSGWSLFGEIGIGLGWMSNTPDTNLVGDSLKGFLDYGVGVKLKTKQGYVIRIGPRFHHRSDVTIRDAGMNGYGVMISVTK